METIIVAGLSLVIIIAAVDLAPDLRSRGTGNLPEMPLRAPQKAAKKRRALRRPKNRPGTRGRQRLFQGPS